MFSLFITQGPEVEIVETALYNNKTYIFAGSQRLSSIIVYSVSDDITRPNFELLYRAGGTNDTWNSLHNLRNIGDANLQDIM